MWVKLKDEKEDVVDAALFLGLEVENGFYEDETPVSVIFETLPDEPAWERFLRFVLKARRRGEDVVLGYNGDLLVIKRGVIVELPFRYVRLLYSVGETLLARQRHRFGLVKKQEA